MMIRLFFFIFLFYNPLIAQVNLYKNQPLLLEPNLAGSFGELRNHHFHSGIDLRTGGKIGQPVLAVQDGYLKRLTSKSNGFGMALYIAHPSGHTSVYAHLDRFQERFHNLLIKNSSERKSNRLDLYFTANDYRVSAGDTIGWSGNSGSSSGPHLHFEWRDSRTQEPLNPFDYGLAIGKDQVEPKILSIHTKSGQKVNRIWSDTLVISDWQDIGVEIIEQQHLGGPKLGIKSMSVWIEDINEPNQQEVPDFSWEMKRFSFSNTRGADGHMQHDIHSRTKKRTYRIAPVSQPAKIWNEIYSFPGNGIYDLTIMIETYSGQNAISKGPVKRDTDHSSWLKAGKVISPIGWESPPDKIEIDNMNISWGKNSFMEPIKPTIERVDDINESKWFCKPDIPVIKSINYYWTPPEDYPKELLSKTVLIGNDPRGTSRIVGKPLGNGQIHFKMKIWGELSITSDQQAPQINYIGKTTFQNKDAFCFKLKDNLLDIINYRVEIDGEWSWAYYDAKKENLLIPISFDKDRIDFKIFAEDEGHNGTTFEYSIQ